MGAQTVSKPLPRYFALFAVALMVLSVAFVISDDAEESDAYSHGSQSSPLTSINFSFCDLGTSDLEPYYVKVGSSVTIVGDYLTDEVASAISVNILSVTSGYGLTKSNGEEDPLFGTNYYLGKVSGTISKAGTISISVRCNVDGVGGVLEGTQTLKLIAIADTTPVTSISISGSSSVTKGSTITLTATTSPTSATDRHVTWSISSGSSYASIQSTSDTTTGGKCVIKGVSAGSVTVKATAADGSGVYKTKTITVSNPSYSYYLYYDDNGGSGGPGSASKTSTSTSSTLSFTISSTEPTRSGYTFLGWSKSSTATSATYTAGDTVSVTYDDLTLYAVWQQNKQNYYAYLYYNANGGSSAPSTQSDSIYATSASGSKSFTISSTEPTRSGYQFLGWSTSSSAASASYDPGDSISVSYGSSKTLYAVWAKTYTSTLAFSANGGSGAPSSQTYTGTSTSSHTFTIPSTKPTKSGYLFLGWATSSGATTASYQPGGTISVPYDGTTTLYAVWQTAQLDITSEPATKSLKVNQSWSYTPTTNIDGCTVSVSGADWLSVSNGTISGTPTASGSYNVTVTVSKTGGYVSDSQTFVLKVYSALGFNSVPGANGMFAYAE